MAARGLGNIEIAQTLFVTRKTVEKHLGNAYTKLDVKSRAELPAHFSIPERSRSRRRALTPTTGGKPLVKRVRPARQRSRRSLT